MVRLQRLPSRPGEFHPEPLTDPDLSFSLIRLVLPREGGSLWADRLPHLSQSCATATDRGCCLDLILIELSSAAAAIITRMPARPSAICIASPSEMSSRAMRLAIASRTPRQ